ncbi:hypothetical protein [Butyrivibrio sp. AE3003]|uniref:hypothetical protein n=1 Tax=Butyrivibrio sp. AE3003 TaxID=1496721 RepID=UPI00047D98B5|nr:hypothetical protein [Butyrivibrio sp. AE3003]
MNSLNKSRKIIILIIGIVSFFILLSGVLFAIYFRAFLSSGSQTPFISYEWKEGDRTTRHTMYDDLVKSNNLIGMNTEEINQLLGKCDEYHSTTGNMDDADYYWDYIMGYSVFKGHEMLYIHFENDIVTEVSRVRVNDLQTIR